MHDIVEHGLPGIATTFFTTYGDAAAVACDLTHNDIK